MMTFKLFTRGDFLNKCNCCDLNMCVNKIVYVCDLNICVKKILYAFYVWLVYVGYEQTKSLVNMTRQSVQVYIESRFCIIKQMYLLTVQVNEKCVQIFADNDYFFFLLLLSFENTAFAVVSMQKVKVYCESHWQLLNLFIIKL